MLKQRQASPGTGWLFVCLGLVILVAQLLVDWSAWPSFRTILAAGIAVCALCISAMGAFVVVSTRRGR